MPEYGAYTRMPGGSLLDPYVRQIAMANAECQARETAAKLGIEMPPLKFIEQHNVPEYAPSRSSLEDAGFTPTEIEETLAWAETVEWPRYHDSLGWKFHVE